MSTNFDDILIDDGPHRALEDFYRSCDIGPNDLDGKYRKMMEFVNVPNITNPTLFQLEMQWLKEKGIYI